MTTAESFQEKATRIAKENPSFVDIPAQQPPYPQCPTPSTAPTFGVDSWTGFMFLQSFRESFDYLVMLGRVDKAYKFLEALMIYGTEGIDITDDPYVALAMAPAKKVIDKYREKFQKRDQAKKK